ncbi:MAG: TetR/AcrR family transcriptional regulator [Thermomicrobiales bacterium]|nr:TetR/AcrR family transcriptional regulator [Thermomicrobiales bacterium]
MTQARQRGRPRLVSVEQRQTDLLDAALELFLQQGIEATTIAQIARRAGIASGTVYLYVDNKEALVSGVRARVRQAMAGEIASLIDRWEGSFDTLLDAVVDASFDLQIAYQRELDLFRRQVQPEAIRGLAESRRQAVVPFAQAIRRAVERGEAAVPGGDPELLAYLISSAIEDAVYSCLTFGIPSDVDALRTAAREMAHKLLAPNAAP